MNRRKFIQSAASVGFLLNLNKPTKASNSGKTIRWGFIGVGGRGTKFLKDMLKIDGLEFPAICDINVDRLNQAIDIVKKSKNYTPEGYSGNPYDYRRLLQRDDIDAVLIETPKRWHARMSIDGLNADKHVLTDVPGAYTIKECWDLVEAKERSGKVYMLAENCCYYQQCLAILNMVGNGIFGDTTYAECGYIHEIRQLMFKPDGSLTWRGEIERDLVGNIYPTHGIGPVAQWLGINRGDRFESLVSMCTSHGSLKEYAVEKFGGDHPSSKINYAARDMTMTLLKTAKGKIINLQFDQVSFRPHPTTTHFYLQGTKGAFKDEDREQKIYIDGRSKANTWEPLSKYIQEYDSPIWQRWKEQSAGSGHGGVDMFAVYHFLESVRTGKPAFIDVYDSAAWSAIIPLSAKSIDEGGAVQKIPDFTKGMWKNRNPL